MGYDKQIELLQAKIEEGEQEPRDLGRWRRESAVAVRLALGEDHPHVHELLGVRFVPGIVTSRSTQDLYERARRQGLRKALGILRASVFELEGRAALEASGGQAVAVLRADAETAEEADEVPAGHNLQGWSAATPAEKATFVSLAFTIAGFTFAFGRGDLRWLGPGLLAGGALIVWWLWRKWWIAVGLVVLAVALGALLVGLQGMRSDPPELAVGKDLWRFEMPSDDDSTGVAVSGLVVNLGDRPILLTEARMTAGGREVPTQFVTEGNCSGGSFVLKPQDPAAIDLFIEVDGRTSRDLGAGRTNWALQFRTADGRLIEAEQLLRAGLTTDDYANRLPNLGAKCPAFPD